MIPHGSSFAPHPLALLAAALAAGILTAHFFSIPAAVLLCCAAGAALLVVWSLHKRNTALATLFIVITTLLGGAVLETIARRSAPADQLKRLLDDGVIAAGDTVELTGVMERPPEFAPESFYLTLRLEK